MSTLIKISISQGNSTYLGTVTTIELDNEFRYFIDLGESLQFTLHLNENVIWKSNNPFVDQEMVSSAGDFIEGMEDFTDVLSELDILRN